MMLFKAAILLLLGSLLTTTEAKTVKHDWNLVYKNVNPDGLHIKRVISINKQWPYVFLE
jgi:hypothetical protein